MFRYQLLAVVTMTGLILLNRWIFAMSFDTGLRAVDLDIGIFERNSARLAGRKLGYEFFALIHCWVICYSSLPVQFTGV